MWERLGEKMKHVNALWCLTVIADGSYRQSLKEKETEIQKDSTMVAIIASQLLKGRVRTESGQDSNSLCPAANATSVKCMMPHFCWNAYRGFELALWYCFLCCMEVCTTQLRSEKVTRVTFKSSFWQTFAWLKFGSSSQNADWLRGRFSVSDPAPGAPSKNGVFQQEWIQSLKHRPQSSTRAAATQSSTSRRVGVRFQMSSS